VPFFGDGEERDSELTPLTPEEAVIVYNTLTDRRLEFEDAFPCIEYADA